MVCRRCSFTIGLALSAILGGCRSHTDLTQTLEVQRSGVLGQRYEVKNDSDLIRDKPSNTLQIVPQDYPHWPRHYRVKGAGRNAHRLLPRCPNHGVGWIYDPSDVLHAAMRSRDGP